MKRVVISSFITLVVVALISAAYFIFQRYPVITADPLNAIPSNAIFFVELNNTKQFLKKLSSENLLASLVNMDSSKNDQLMLFDSVLSFNEEIKKIVESKPLFVSAHLTRASSLDYLFLINVPPSWDDDKTEHFLIERFHHQTPVNRRVYENVSVHELSVAPEKYFSFAVTNGVFIGSCTSFLIDDAIRQLKNGSPVSKSKAFAKISGTSAKKENDIYINYISVGEFLSTFSTNGNAGFFNTISSFARWSRLELDMQNNNLNFHGYTASTDTSDYITALRNQQPQKMEVQEILPLRTGLFIHVGVSNYRNYFQHLFFNSVYFDPPDKRIRLINALENKFHAGFEKNLTGWIDKEVALVITEPGSSFFENSTYACIKAKNIEAAIESLLLVQHRVNTATNLHVPVNYRKHTVGYIDIKGLAPLFYSNLFNKINSFYFTDIGSYVVVANQEAALHSFIDDYEDNNTLMQDPGVKSLFKTATGVTNFFLYVNFSRSKNIFRHYVSDEDTGMPDKNINLSNRFSSLTCQLVNRNGNFETLVQLSERKEKINRANLLWASQLDTSIQMKPFIITGAEKKNKFIVIQDEANTLYLLDEAGNIRWKKPLKEKIISDFHPVDAYKNGQLQILFNTASELFLLDLDGNDYGNYPIRLPASATNGCEVFDFDQSKNYKIIVACSNKIIYAYEISGKPVSGWMFNQPVSAVVNPLQNFTVKNSDYLLLYNHSGNVYMLDKKGNIRFALKQFFIARNSTFTFEPADSSDDAHLVTTDTIGRMLNLYFNGMVKTKSFGLQSSGHTFTAFDMNGDGMYEYAFLDHNRLKVFRRDSSLVFSYVFKENLFPQFSSFSFTTPLPQLGVGCLSENRFFVLDVNGQLSKGFPVKGFRASSTSVWGNEGKKILVTSGTDGNVYGYMID